MRKWKKYSFSLKFVQESNAGLGSKNRDADSYLGITQIRSKILYVCMTVYKSQCTRASVLDLDLSSRMSSSSTSIVFFLSISVHGCTVVFTVVFLVIEAHGGTWFRTPCPIVVRSRSKC